MFDPADLPWALRGHAFTAAQATVHGLTRRVLQGRHFVQVHRGVYLPTGTVLTFEMLVEADLLRLPADAHLSHVTGLQWLGIDIGTRDPRHYSTNTTSQSTLRDVVLHRRQDRLQTVEARGRRTLDPERLLVDAAAMLPAAALVRVADELVRRGDLLPDAFTRFALTHHLDGVQAARRAAAHVRERVDSARETDVRLLLVSSGLPEPEVNVEIHDAAGQFLARGDLVYRRHRVLVEYDGRHHAEDPVQWHKDLRRRERLEAAGWTVVVVGERGHGDTGPRRDQGLGGTAPRGIPGGRPGLRPLPLAHPSPRLSPGIS
ncbi:DUF559 domain-containing protein [Aeromicrobium sp. CF4.19]|uniref:DUF559 domain-containing protein n=1 Tax=Aeromicrobium sp. CF4.19 TaxID=3373082 RepID=UPI003EE6669D